MMSTHRDLGTTIAPGRRHTRGEKALVLPCIEEAFEMAIQET
jgi:hypothetical protein